MSDAEAQSAPIDLRDPDVFDRLLAELGIASLIVVAGARMGAALRQQVEPGDVVQDVILEAWCERATFRGSTLRAARNWALTMLDRRLIDLARHHGAARRGGGTPALTLDGGSQLGQLVPVRSTTPSRLAQERERARAIEAALDELDPTDRELMLRAVYGGASVSEAARELGLPERTARDRVQRALRAMSQHLERTGS